MDVYRNFYLVVTLFAINVLCRSIMIIYEHGSVQHAEYHSFSSVNQILQQITHYLVSAQISKMLRIEVKDRVE